MVSHFLKNWLFQMGVYRIQFVRSVLIETKICFSLCITWSHRIFPLYYNCIVLLDAFHCHSSHLVRDDNEKKKKQEFSPDLWTMQRTFLSVTEFQCEMCLVNMKCRRISDLRNDGRIFYNTLLATICNCSDGPNLFRFVGVCSFLVVLNKQ